MVEKITDKQVHDARFEKRKPSYLRQIGDIEKKLRGYGEGDLALSPTQIDKLTWNLAVLYHRLENGHATRWDMLPENLIYTNPQGSQRPRYRGRNFT